MQCILSKGRAALSLGSTEVSPKTSPLLCACGLVHRRSVGLSQTWRDGTMHLVMSPLEFMHPLAALALGRAGLPWTGQEIRHANRLLRGDQLNAVSVADGSATACC